MLEYERRALEAMGDRAARDAAELVLRQITGTPLARGRTRDASALNYSYPERGSATWRGESFDPDSRAPRRAPETLPSPGRRDYPGNRRALEEQQRRNEGAWGERYRPDPGQGTGGFNRDEPVVTLPGRIEDYEMTAVRGRDGRAMTRIRRRPYRDDLQDIEGHHVDPSEMEGEFENGDCGCADASVTLEGPPEEYSAHESDSAGGTVSFFRVPPWGGYASTGPAGDRRRRDARAVGPVHDAAALQHVNEAYHRGPSSTAEMMAAAFSRPSATRDYRF